MKGLGSEIYAAVSSGNLAQPFKASTGCPGWAEDTYHTFLGKHATENSQKTALFVQVGRGQYRLNPTLAGELQRRRTSA